MELLKKKVKDNAGTLWCIFLIFLWIFPDCYKGMEKPYYIGLIAFFLSAAAVEYIKNKAVVFLIHILTTVIAAIFDISYVFWALPALVILSAHSEAMKEYEKGAKKSTEAVNLYTTASLILTVVTFGYSIFRYAENVGHVFISIIYEIRAMLPIILFFMILIIRASKKGDKVIKSKNIKTDFLFIYYLGLAGLVMTDFYCFSETLYRIHRYEELFQYWFFAILIIGKNGDPFFNSFIESVEAFLNTKNKQKAK